VSWNHNLHYLGFVMSELPSGCGRALDVGCGRGALARKLARSCQEVVAIDTDQGCVDHARTAASGQANITFVNGDVLTLPMQPTSFDFVVAVATLHHLPLHNALERFRDLLRPEGVLVIVGLYRIATPMDYLFSVTALPISWAIRFSRGEEEVGAPLQDPTETLRTIREECNSVLPGAVLRRRLFFRYTVVWRKH
jgi:2-polyprenyl-3-methyl-5-hydroxy-6-metoxy-1,4-benzoquinol methylase